MVYAANRQLYLREMAEFEARPIPGTRAENSVTNPVFSPDGKSVAFFSNSATSASVKRIAVSGGAASTLSPVSIQMGMSWGDEGIIFALYEKGILRVSPNGGQPETLIPAAASEVMGDPQLLPGGEVILFTVGQYRAGLQLSDKWRIVAKNLKSGTQKTLVQDASGARYLPTGHLVYWKDGVLFAAPFNLRRMEITGSSVSVVEGIRPGLGVAQFAYSSTGTLVYIPGAVTAAGQYALARVDRKGEVEPLKAPPAAYAYPRASKDGKRVAYQIEDSGESSIWVWELAGGTAPRRLTLPGAGSNQYPIWSPDGQRIAFQSDREGDHGIWWQRADGSGTAEHITTPAKGVLHIPDSWSADGQTISFTEEKTGTSEVWTWSLRDKKAAVFASTPGALLGRSAFSPDGHWIAYQSNAQPGSRVYVRRFPPTEPAYEAPQDGDTHHPAWSPDGKELFYVAGASLAGSMSASTRPSVSFGSPVRLLRSGFVTAAPGGVRTFDVLPDGQHFIGVVPVGETESSAGPPQIHVVLNWFEDVRQRAPAK
jgi:Tol biopolymer transport system component